MPPPPHRSDPPFPAFPPLPRRAGLSTVPGRFTGRIRLQTLGRGDGLLGLCRDGVFGPREAPLSVARIDWLYRDGDTLLWQTPAPQPTQRGGTLPTEILRDPQGRAQLLHRDLGAEARAGERLRELGLHPLDPQQLQWRSEEAAQQALPGSEREQLWSLATEDAVASLWNDQASRLQAEGWLIECLPGFAHQAAAADAWWMQIDPDTGAATPARGLARAPVRGGWLLSLGVEVDGEVLDLAPLLADLLRRDARWMRSASLRAIDDTECLTLRAPGGRRISTTASVLKPIVAALHELRVPQPVDGRWRFEAWDAPQLEDLRCQLTGPAAGEGPQALWRIGAPDSLPAWAAQLRQAGTPPPVPAPAGLGVTLRPYQLQGLAWLQHLRRLELGGVLADDMGLGKTAQTIAHLLVEHQAGRLDLPALILLPTSLLFNWQQELQRMAPVLKVLVLHGPRRQQGFEQLAQHQVVLSTYALLWRDLSLLRRQPWHLLILDEAQSVKNADSRSARALRHLRARHRLCLSGTPLENHLGELWSLFDFLMPGFLGSARRFQQQWRKPIEVQADRQQAQRLAARVRPFILRRCKQDVTTELPPKVEITRLVELQGAQRDLYESVRVNAHHLVRRVLQAGHTDSARFSILDALLRLRQVCCDPTLVPGVAQPGSMPNAKIEALQDLLPTLVAEGRRMLVFSQFTGMLTRVAQLLDALALPWLRLCGDTPPAQRGPLVNRFQQGEVPVFLISLKAGGTGLNLSAADTVIHLDPWWNPAVERQASDRAHRIGQDRTVFIHRLVVKGSLEERMLELQQRKSLLAETVLGLDQAQPLKFGAAELEGLLGPLEPLR